MGLGAESEVCDEELVLGGEYEVVGLDVSVEVVMLCEGAIAVDGLLEVAESRCFWEFAVVFDEFCEGALHGELYDDVDIVFGVGGEVELGDVGFSRQFLEHFDFGLSHEEVVFSAVFQFWDYFYCDGFV